MAAADVLSLGAQEQAARLLASSSEAEAVVSKYHGRTVDPWTWKFAASRRRAPALRISQEDRSRHFGEEEEGCLGEEKNDDDLSPNGNGEGGLQRPLGELTSLEDDPDEASVRVEQASGLRSTSLGERPLGYKLQDGEDPVQGFRSWLSWGRAQTLRPKSSGQVEGSGHARGRARSTSPSERLSDPEAKPTTVKRRRQLLPFTVFPTASWRNSAGSASPSGLEEGEGDIESPKCASQHCSASSGRYETSLELEGRGAVCTSNAGAQQKQAGVLDFIQDWEVCPVGTQEAPLQPVAEGLAGSAEAAAAKSSDTAVSQEAVPEETASASQPCPAECIQEPLVAESPSSCVAPVEEVSRDADCGAHPQGVGEFEEVDRTAASAEASGDKAPDVPEAVVHQSKVPNASNSEDGPCEHDLLEHNLQQNGLKQLYMAGDGNCQFRSLADQLFGSSDKHQQVRKAVVTHLKQNKARYGPYVPDSFETYIQEMSKDGTWGDHVTLQAAADRYKARITLITALQDRYSLEILPADAKPRLEIWLSYYAGRHFNSARVLGRHCFRGAIAEKRLRLFPVF